MNDSDIYPQGKALTPAQGQMPATLRSLFDDAPGTALKLG
jgi:hypothetical protein